MNEKMAAKSNIGAPSADFKCRFDASRHKRTGRLNGGMTALSNKPLVGHHRPAMR
ncbi:hypothetical protein [Mesorhizobium xinjiangense]|uniref:hypothetical protein n=1 Tax=Mesorhizobium xinjiangense TaxID=2678685 RepID=UPI0012ED4BF6|nr:hypothetical protein [Mesorhizobium xinjiangense]